MNKLVFIKKDNAFTDSKIIAKNAEVNHYAIRQLIDKHKGDFEEFGKIKVTFQMKPSKTNQKEKLYLLNEQQATLLLTYLRNTEPVREFKKNLVRQFYKMREYIQTLVSAKKEFPLLTENIKLLHDDPKPYHYSNECDMLNRLVHGMSAKQFRLANGIEKGESIRPYLTKEQIDLLDTLQKVDVGLLVAFPNFEDRKRRLEWYLSKFRLKNQKTLDI